MVERGDIDAGVGGTLLVFLAVTGLRTANTVAAWGKSSRSRLAATKLNWRWSARPWAQSSVPQGEHPAQGLVG